MEQVVIVTTEDRNGKGHLVVCESMEMAKIMFPGAQKRLATMYTKESFYKMDDEEE